MATCVNPCTVATREHMSIKVKVDPVSPLPNDSVTVTIDMSEHSLLYGGTAQLDIVDIGGSLGGGCVFNQQFNWVSQGTTITTNYFFTMPNDNVKIRISASEWIVNVLPPFNSYWNCEDYIERSIPLCTNPSGCSTGFFSTCQSSSDCGTNNMCVMGMCVPSPIIFIGMAAGLYYLLK